jgi:superfamily II DNA or RNA helicase
MRRGGNLVEFSLDGGPLPPDLEAQFKRELTYTHLHALRGADAYDHLGNYRATRAEIKTLYKISETTGRFNASIGWQYRLKRNCERAGHTVQTFDVGPAHPRPNRYEVNWDRLFEKMDLRAKQDQILAAMEEIDHGLLDVPAGVGKTFLIASHALAHPNARYHIVTDGIDILNRIYRHLVKFIPNVGRVGGGKREFGRVTVISVDSLQVVGEGFDDFHSPNSPDYVIFDEVHKAAAPQTILQLGRYQHCKMYGLSANVGDRFDGADSQLEGIFGETIFQMSYQEAEALGLVLPINVEWIKLDYETPEELKEARGTQLDKFGVWRNEERNRLFAQKIQEFDPDVQVLVMVATVDHAVHLKQFLPEFQLCYDQCKQYDVYVRNGLLDPANEPLMTPVRREQMRQAFEAGTLKKVIATDVWSTGVDFVNLSVLARLDARDSRIMDTQVPCRANRILDGKEYATLIDCMDYWHPTLQRRSNNRKRAYISKGWKQIGLGTRRIGTQAARQNRV